MNLRHIASSSLLTLPWVMWVGLCFRLPLPSLNDLFHVVIALGCNSGIVCSSVSEQLLYSLCVLVFFCGLLWLGLANAQPKHKHACKLVATNITNILHSSTFEHLYHCNQSHTKNELTSQPHTHTTNPFDQTANKPTKSSTNTNHSPRAVCVALAAIK